MLDFMPAAPAPMSCAGAAVWTARFLWLREHNFKYDHSGSKYRRQCFESAMAYSMGDVETCCPLQTKDQLQWSRPPARYTT